MFVLFPFLLLLLASGAVGGPWRSVSPPTHWTFGNVTDVLDAVSGLVAESMPAPHSGLCAKQRYSRVCACSSAYAFQSSERAVFASETLRGALRRQTERIAFFRQVCFIDDATLNQLNGLLCAMEQRPCDADGETVPDSSAAKICRSECRRATDAMQKRVLIMNVWAEAIIKQLKLDVAYKPSDLTQRCAQMWGKFVADCADDNVFSDDETTCVRSVANHTAVNSDVHHMRFRACQRATDAKALGAPCRPEAKFDASRCSSGAAARMENELVLAQVSDQTGSVRIMDKRTQETLAFTLLRIAELQVKPVTGAFAEIHGMADVVIADIKPTLYCSPNQINITWQVLPTARVIAYAELLTEARPITPTFTIPKNSVKVSFAVEGFPFAEHHPNADRFSLELAADMSPFAGFLPSLVHTSLFGIGPDDSVASESSPLEHSSSVIRYAIPTHSFSDGSRNPPFQLGLARFLDSATMFRERRCPRTVFELRAYLFEQSFELDPSMDVVVNGVVPEAEREAYAREIELQLNEPDTIIEGLSAGAEAAIAIVIILILVALVVGVVFWLRRSGRLQLSSERGGVK